MNFISGLIDLVPDGVGLYPEVLPVNRLSPPVSLAHTLIAWQKKSGRHDLPWQQTRDPYAVWVSEIMLQQTQVGTVIPYYLKFRQRFPDITTLAAAPADAVLAHWSGLGYYARARNLQRAAQIIVDQFDGVFPTEFEAILALPGIGRSTAAAISVFCFSEKHAILDGNVKRVLARVYAIPQPVNLAATETEMLALAESLLSEHDIESYTQGLMDLGSTVCTRTKPKCGTCPLQSFCLAYQRGATDRYPVKAARPEKPHREAYFPLVRQGERILLVRRPPRGIWGGLWSLPQFETMTETERWLGANVKKYTQTELTPVAHTFTHFHLTLHPLLIDLGPRTTLRPEESSAWYTLTEALTLGLPAPIRRVISSLA